MNCLYKSRALIVGKRHALSSVGATSQSRFQKCRGEVPSPERVRKPDPYPFFLTQIYTD